MNRINRIIVTAIASLAAIAATAQEVRTDINPALRYYEAMMVSGELAPADHDYLFTNDWQGQTLPPRCGHLIATSSDRQFKLLRAATQAVTPCDWGIDFNEGPATLLPR